MSENAPNSPPAVKSPSMFLRLAIIFVGVIAALAGYIAMQPSDFRVERSITMAAPPEQPFAQVNDFHHWDAWSPWIKLDPNAQTSFEGAESGTGAVFKWAGNADAGVGAMTITDSRPSELVRIRLDFEKPFKDTSTAEFRFEPAGEQTKVTWSMFGKHTFVSKAMCLMMNMDQMIGGKFEEGLASMKRVVEAKP
ncbi:MAG: SRPBCC family protein [Planctomycetaceae bacterium]